MRILHVLQQLPSKTGSGVYYTNLVEELGRAGHQNILLHASQEPYKFQDGKNRFQVQFKSPKLPFPILGMSDEMPYESSLFSQANQEMLDKTLEAFKEKLLYIRENLRPDLIISHHLFLLTNLVREVFKEEKVYAICHGTDLRQLGQHPKFIKMLPNIKRLERIFIVSPGERENIVRMLGVADDRISLLGGGYDQDIFNRNYKRIGSENIKIIFAGKITESKGVFALAGALPHVESVHPDLTLHIIGNASQEQARTLREKANNSPSLHIYNAKNQKLMAEELKQADIFVLPSYYEALGLIAIEALACGKLCVTSNIDGLKKQLGPQVNQSGCILYTDLPRLYDLDKPYPEDVADYERRLAENIIKQIDKVKAGYEIPCNIQAEIDKNSWENLTKKLLKFLS